jgi:rRNA pseudouridine-1189 N-methylase Emg1 (Nep1/Mra1 family)
LCEYVEDTKETNFTEEEQEIGLEVKWMTLDEVINEFENNMTLHEHGPMIHNREFLGLMNSI